MKLSDGTVIAVRQAPERVHKVVIDQLHFAVESPGTAALAIAQAIGPWVGEEGAAVDPRDLARFLAAHQEDLIRIMSAVLGVSIAETPEWIKNVNFGSPSDVA